MIELIFSQLFYKPDQELIQMLENGGLNHLNVMVDKFESETDDQGLKKTLKYIEAQILKADFLDELKAEYNTLFFGPSKILAPPYSSIYVDGFGQVETNTTKKVTEIYAQWGLKLREDINEPADHIAFEFDFLYHISNLIDKDFNANAIDQKKEFISHMNNWIGKFSNQVINTQHINFYGPISKMAVLYIKKQNANK